MKQKILIKVYLLVVINFLLLCKGVWAQDATEIVRKANDLMNGKTSESIASMTIQTTRMEPYGKYENMVVRK